MKTYSLKYFPVAVLSETCTVIMAILKITTQIYFSIEERILGLIFTLEFYGTRRLSYVSGAICL